MKKIIFASFLLCLALACPVYAAVLQNPNNINSEITIDKDGKSSVKNARVFQFAGSTFYVKLFWGESYIRMTVKTDGKTVITKKYGEALSVSDMKLGDFVDIEGILEPADTFILKAVSLKDNSDERGQGKFSGTVLKYDQATGGVLVKLSDGKVITVIFPAGAAITKGTRTIGFYDIKMGDIMENAEGVFDYAKNTLTAKNAKIYIDMNRFRARNFQGTLKALSSTTLPANMTVTIDSVDYVVKVPADCVIMNTIRANTSISRFVVGDTIRIYGAIPEGDDAIINAYLVRNISL